MRDETSTEDAVAEGGTSTLTLFGREFRFSFANEEQRAQMQTALAQTYQLGVVHGLKESKRLINVALVQLPPTED